MNKKGLLDFNAGIVVLVLVVYFIFFSFIVYSVSSAFPDSDIDDSSTGVYSEILTKVGLQSLEYCDSPRLRYDLEESAPYELSKVNENNLRCDFTDGILGESICESYKGCGWANGSQSVITNWFCQNTGWLCADNVSSYTCLGYINSDYYGINSTGFGNSSMRVSSYYFMDYYNTNGADYQNLISFLGYDNFSVIFGYTAKISSKNVCTHPNVILNKTNCDLFQCTWTSTNTNNITLKQQKDNFINIVVKTLTFSYDFGFTNATTSMLMNLIFIFIPLLILIIASIYAIFG